MNAAEHSESTIGTFGFIQFYEFEQSMGHLASRGNRQLNGHTVEPAARPFDRG